MDWCKTGSNKILEENIGRTFFGINPRNIFLDPHLTVMKIKTKINKWDLIKFKKFCTAKETINKMKIQPTEGEEIFENDVTDKRLTSKTTKSSFSSIKKANTIKK